jgi:glutamine synthetase
MTSSNSDGFLSLPDLRAAAQSGDIDTILAAIPDMYGRLMGKRLTARQFLEHVAGGGMHVCDYLVACDMEMDPVPGYRVTSWESGYGDFMAKPDLSTMRRAAWIDKTAIVICDLLDEKGENAVSVAPRQMLQKQLAKLAERGWHAKGGSEIELYLFDETYESAREKGYANLKPAGNYVEDYHLFQGLKEEGVIGAIRRQLEASGIEVECSKGEWGPGQQEINLQFCEVLEQADRNVLYKHAAKEIAWQQGKAITFMAKWHEDQAGSSMHVHISLWNTEQGSSVFTGDQDLNGVASSSEFRWFLGGMIQHAREISAFLAPNVASYKRYQAGSFAPTSLAWSRDNRTAGFRVVGHGKSLRLECRVPGADANPYLVYAALIAAGLDGIENQIDPPECFSGDVYQAQDLPRVPGSLHEAIGELERSEFAKAAFGEDVVWHYLHYFRTEQRKFDAVVTDWERARFFERI